MLWVARRIGQGKPAGFFPGRTAAAYFLVRTSRSVYHVEECRSLYVLLPLEQDGTTRTVPPRNAGGTVLGFGGPPGGNLLLQSTSISMLDVSALAATS